jgi:hypothetical protein
MPARERVSSSARSARTIETESTMRIAIRRSALRGCGFITSPRSFTVGSISTAQRCSMMGRHIAISEAKWFLFT